MSSTVLWAIHTWNDSLKSEPIAKLLAVGSGEDTVKACDLAHAEQTPQEVHLAEWRSSAGFQFLKRATVRGWGGAVQSWWSPRDILCFFFHISSRHYLHLVVGPKHSSSYVSHALSMIVFLRDILAIKYAICIVFYADFSMILVIAINW